MFIDNDELESFYASAVVMITVLFIALDRIALIYRYSLQVLEPLSVLSGAILIVAALKIYAKAKLIEVLHKDKASTLITDGIYSKTRNPKYSAILLLSSGMILLNSNMILFFMIPIYYAHLSLIIIYREESSLEKSFDNDWLEYKKRVNRLIPIRVIRAC